MFKISNLIVVPILLAGIVTLLAHLTYKQRLQVYYKYRLSSSPPPAPNYVLIFLGVSASVFIILVCFNKMSTNKTSGNSPHVTEGGGIVGLDTMLHAIDHGDPDF